MKILLATPLRFQPGDPHRFWARALRQLNHRVKLFPLGHGSRLVNSWRLFQTIARWQPGEVFFSAGRDAVYPVKETIFFCGVPPARLSRSERATGLLAKLVVTNDERHCRQWLELGAKKAVNLPISAFNPMGKKRKNPARVFPVSFVGTLFPGRQRQLKRLVKLAPKIKIWGWLPPKTPLSPELKPFYQGEAWGAKVDRIYRRSLIGLNLTPEHMSRSGNIRPFEISGNGALLLTDRFNSDWFIDQKEAVKFKSLADGAKKIGYFLDHGSELEAIARLGQLKTRRQHTYKHRFARLLKML